MGQDKNKSINDAPFDKNSLQSDKGQLNQREIIKLKLKQKYDLDDEQLEKVLSSMEDKGILAKANEDHVQQFKGSSAEKSAPIKAVVNPPEDIESNVSNQNEDLKKEYDAHFNRKLSEISNDDSVKNDVTVKGTQNQTESLDEDKSDVDSILSDIVPDFGQDVSIELKNVDLTFDLIDDKVDTVKESFIRIIKRNRSRKVKFKVLNDISFKIYKGEKVGILGYNGAGKSTLLKVITGIYYPDKGEVATYGKISPLLSLGAGFDRNYSGRRNIYLNGAVLGYDKKFLQAKEKDIIEFSELGKFIDYPIKNYSSGMLAKLGFSIATMVNPDILIIDEILGVGDVSFRRKSGDKIRSLMDGKTTVLLVSHSIPQIRQLCDKAIWIDDGKVREIGDVDEVCDHYMEDSEKASKEQLENIQFR